LKCGQCNREFPKQLATVLGGYRNRCSSWFVSRRPTDSCTPDEQKQDSAVFPITCRKYAVAAQDFGRCTLRDSLCSAKKWEAAYVMLPVSNDLRLTQYWRCRDVRRDLKVSRHIDSMPLNYRHVLVSKNVLCFSFNTGSNRYQRLYKKNNPGQWSWDLTNHV
jgi:hypothetical protein